MSTRPDYSDARGAYRGPGALPPAFFESPRARAAMAGRDVRAVYAVLARMGVAQRRIAALTSQSQSEISEIRAGRRVQSVEVLERIADGLNRGWWGLTHTDDLITPQAHTPPASTPGAGPATAGLPSSPQQPPSVHPAWHRNGMSTDPSH